MKKFYFILIFIAGFTLKGLAQLSESPNNDPIVKFYPNPATTVVNFEFKKLYKKSYTFQIYNFMGKKVMELKSPSTKFSITLQDFFRGVYIYQIHNANGEKIESGKFTKW